MPFVVFVAELCVVTISTVRIIFIARGMKGLAAVLGFFEITIWLFAIGQIMQHLTDIGCYVGFAGGFTLGNFLGVLLEKRLGLGTLTIHTIMRGDPTQLIRNLRTAGYSVTSLNAEGGSGPVKVVFSVIQRKQLDEVVAIIQTIAPDAFYAVDEIKAVSPGLLPPRGKPLTKLLPSFLTFGGLPPKGATDEDHVDNGAWRALDQAAHAQRHDGSRMAA